MLISSGIGWGQLQFALEANEVSFPPTTVDSTSTISLIVINELALPQEVSLSGTSVPFDLALASFSIPANDTLSFTAFFTPEDVETYTDTLMITGNVFGNDTLFLSGEGTLPEVSLIDDTVSFETVSINSIHAREFEITNTGVGTLVIGEITSSIAEFSAMGNQEIAAGDTATFVVQFYTELADFYQGE
jgi:hypothetical protein